MKVKELAEIFKISSAELLAILPNVGVDVSQKEETNVDKEVEKKRHAIIKEINAFHNIQLEKIIVDKLENFIINNKNRKLNV